MKQYRLVFLFTLFVLSLLAYRYWFFEPSSDSIDPVLIPIDTNQLASIEIQPCGSRPYQLTRESGRWILTDKGIHQVADQPRVEELLRVLHHLQTYGLVQPNSSLQTEFPPEDHPGIQVRVRSQQADLRRFWLSCPGSIEKADTALARVEGEEALFLVSEEQAQRLNQPSQVYRPVFQLELPTDLDLYQSVRILYADKEAFTWTNTGISWEPALNKASFSRFIANLNSLPLDQPLPVQEDPPAFWQLELIDQNRELQWLSVLRDTSQAIFFLESSSRPNLYYPVDSLRIQLPDLFHRDSLPPGLLELEN